jgi:hypothetical protein
MEYRLFPQKPGRFTLGPYSFELNGEQLQIPEVTLDVRALDGNTSPREMIFARIQLPDTPPYVHQVFEVTLGLYSLPSVELARDINLVGGFPETGFAIGGFEELQMVREEVDGQFYNLRRFRTRARALTAGTFTLQPTLRAGVVDRNQPRQRRDPFGGFFDDPFSRPSATPVNATTPAATLTVRPYPRRRPPSGLFRRRRPVRFHRGRAPARAQGRRAPHCLPAPSGHGQHRRRAPAGLRRH